MYNKIRHRMFLFTIWFLSVVAILFLLLDIYYVIQLTKEVVKEPVRITDDVTKRLMKKHGTDHAYECKRNNKIVKCFKDERGNECILK